MYLFKPSENKEPPIQEHPNIVQYEEDLDDDAQQYSPADKK